MVSGPLSLNKFSRVPESYFQVRFGGWHDVRAQVNSGRRRHMSQVRCAQTWRMCLQDGMAKAVVKNSLRSVSSNRSLNGVVNWSGKGERYGGR